MCHPPSTTAGPLSWLRVRAQLHPSATVVAALERWVYFRWNRSGPAELARCASGARRQRMVPSCTAMHARNAPLLQFHKHAMPRNTERPCRQAMHHLMLLPSTLTRCTVTKSSQPLRMTNLRKEAAARLT